MPSLEQRDGRFRVVFRFAGEKFSRALKTANAQDAEASFARLKDNLRRAELGHLGKAPFPDICRHRTSNRLWRPKQG